MNTEENDYPERKRDFWRCQSCGHGFVKPWPKDRAKYYSDPLPAKCPKCKSDDACPEGY